MSRIMMDNRGLTNAVTGMYNIKNILYRNDLADFLTYFVLWDEIYYPRSSMEALWKGIINEKEIFEYVKPIYMDEIGLYDEREMEILCEKVPGQYKNAVRYWFFSNQYGLDYCPSKSNSEFLTGFLNSDLYNIKMDIIDHFSKDVLDNCARLKTVSSNMTVPDIGDYIIRNTDEGGRYLKTAIDVKNDKEFRQFKRYLDKIEEQVCEGNIVEYRNCLNDLDDMTNEIGSRRAGMIKNISFSISFIPFSVGMNIEVNNLKRRSIQLNFLKKIAEYYLL